jgi:hypothetical protein
MRAKLMLWAAVPVAAGVVAWFVLIPGRSGAG